MNIFVKFFIGITTFFAFMNNLNAQPNKIIAHRGAWKAFNLPQNSVASLQKAIELGCYGSEFDVQMTRDSILVVNHDADFLGLPIETSTYQELCQLKLSNGETIPTLEAFLKIGLQQKKTKLIFELKTATSGSNQTIVWANESLKLIKKLGAENIVEFILFDYETAVHIAKNTAIKVSYLKGDKDPMTLHNHRLAGFDYNQNVLKQNPNYIESAQSLQLITNVWTVNEVEDIQYFLDQNIDFITTDEPEIALKLSKSKP